MEKKKSRLRLRKVWRILLVIGLLLVVGFGFLVYQFYDTYWKSATTFDEASHLLHIPRNSSFDDVIQILERDKLVTDIYLLRSYAKLKGYDGKQYSGCYTLKHGTSLRDLMLLLISRRQTPIRLVVPSVRTTEELAGRLAKQLDIDSLELLSQFSDPRVAESYHFTLATFPAMFIPNTYEVYWDTSPQKLLQRLHKEYLAFWNTARKEQARALGLSEIEVATLASIIQEEVLHEDELPKIARVYLNRLRIQMPLQACPTAKFAAGDMTLTRVLHVHTQIESPYNTYKHLGLPPGPIRYPSMAALKAVLHPARHDYLFFCAKADFSGYHQFSRSAEQHARYAREYQRELNRRGIR